MNVDAEITVVCENVRAGLDFRALFYDRVSERHYSASGRTALEAIAWCLDEYVRHVVLGLGPSMARRGDERPGDCLLRAASTPEPARPVAPARTAAVDAVEPASGCFEARIPTRPMLRLHDENAPTPRRGKRSA